MNTDQLYVRSSIIALTPITGYFPKVTMCKGPTPSTNKGLDDICCANCNALRVYYYKQMGKFVESQRAINFLMTVGIHHKLLLDVIRVSVCDQTVVHYFPSSCFSETSVCKERLKELCTIMQSSNLIDEGIEQCNIADHLIADKHGLPFFIPTNSIKRVSSYGDDEGVVIDNGILQVTDSEEMYKSGKWAHMVLYWTLINWINGKKNVIKVTW